MSEPEENNPYKKEYSEIRINGGFATIYEALYRSTRKLDSKPKIRKTSIPFDLMYAKLSNAFTGYSGVTQMNLIPENCRYHEQLKNNIHIFVVEEPPAVRTVLISDNYLEHVLTHRQSQFKTKEITSETMNFYETSIKSLKQRVSEKFNRAAPVKLSFPYVIMFLCLVKRGKFFERVLSPYVVFKRTPIYGFADPLLLAPLGNITGGFEVCIGSGRESGSDMEIIKQNPASVIKYYRKLFWNNVFNLDFQNNINTYANENIDEFRDYIRWNSYSENNPGFIYTAPFKKFHLDFGGVLSVMKQRINMNNYNEKPTYAFIENAISSPFISDVKSKDTSENLIFDITNEYYLNEKTSIMAGDLLTLPNKRTILFETFLSTSLAGRPSHYRLLINNKHRVIVKINNSFNKFLVDAIENATTLMEIKTPTGVIKPGDLVSFLNETPGAAVDTVITVKSIKIKNDNTIDLVSTNGPSYIMNSLKNLTKVNLDNLYLGEDKLDIKKIKDKTCLFETSIGYRTSFRSYVIDTKFLDIVPENSMLVARFKAIKHDPNSSSDIYKTAVSTTPNQTSNFSSTSNFGICHLDLIDKLIEVPTSVPVNLNGTITVLQKPYYKHPNNKRIFTSNDRNKLSLATIYATLKNMITKGYLKITSIGRDLEFKIGDNIVVFDRNPLKMLDVRKIIGMAHIKDSNDQNADKIQFITKNRSDQNETIDYIRNSEIVGLPTVRKIVGKINDLQYGFKIQSKVDQFPCFPKDSVNIIIGFIVDTITEPMVLLSNAQTLWFSDINTKNFNIIPPTNRKYKTLDHTLIDYKDFKFQCGDIISLKSYHKTFNAMIVIDGTLRNNKIMNSSVNLKTNCHIVISENFDSLAQVTTHDVEKNNICLNCIPSPRLKSYENIENTLANIKPRILIPTFLGEFIIPTDFDNLLISEKLNDRKIASFSSEHRSIHV